MLSWSNRWWWCRDCSVCWPNDRHQLGWCTARRNHQRRGKDLTFARFVSEEAVGMRGLYVVMLHKVFDETVVGNLSGVWESVHTLANFHIDVVLVDFVFEMVLLQP